MASTSTISANPSFVVVSSIRAKGPLPAARYLIRIILGKQELETTKIKPFKSELAWATPVMLTIEELESTDLTLELCSIAKDSVFHFAKKSSPVSVGKSTASWDDADSQDTSRELTLGGVVVSFKLQVSTMEKLVEKDLDDASKATHAMKQFSIPESVGLGGEVLADLQPAFDATQPFLEKFEAVVGLMDKLTKVHPYLNAAWVVLSAIPKVYMQELAQNQQIVDLLESLKETYKFILKDENLQQLDSKNVRELLVLLANHTHECTYFIQSLAAQSHRARLVGTVFASPKKRIDDLLKRLEELQKQLTALLTQAAAVGAKQSKEEVAKGMAFVGRGLDDLNQKIDLNDIPYAGGVSYNTKKCCLPNTRTSLLQQIRDWVDCFDEEETEKVFLLTGVAGSGKSSIAHSICHHYDQLNRLGSAFFFNIRSSNPPGGELVFSTLARDLADTFPLYKASLAAVAHTRRIRQTKQPGEQFRSFIVKPAEALAESEVLSVGPVLLVIDALDECPEETKEELIQTLVEDLSDLPSNFRFLITSRPDEIQELREAEFVRHVDLSSIGKIEAEADVRLYIQRRLAKVLHKLDKHRATWLDDLVKQSEGLFIWADTVCKEIASPKSKTPTKVLDDILKNGGSGIDDLYQFALQRAVGDDDETIAHFKSLMAHLVILKWPMSINELNFMQSFVDANDDFPDDVSILVSHLGAVLGGALNPNEPLHFLHTSFRDFLLDKARSGPFCTNDDDAFAGAHLSLSNTCAAVLRLLTSTDDPRLTDKANRRPIGYSFLVAKHLEESGRKPDVDLLGSIDIEAMVDWRWNNFFNEATVRESNAAYDGWISLVKLQFDPEDFMTKLRASPPRGYSWSISLNDQNPFQLRSRSVHITLFNPTWCTSVCAVTPKGCLRWGNAWVAFISPQNTVLVWSAFHSKYIGQPIRLGEDEVVQMVFDYNGDYLAALTSENNMVLFDVVSGRELGRVVIDPSKGLPTCFTVSDDDLALFKFPNAEESSAFDTLSSTLYPNIDGITRLTPRYKDEVCDYWEKVCQYDLL